MQFKIVNSTQNRILISHLAICRLPYRPTPAAAIALQTPFIAQNQLTAAGTVPSNAHNKTHHHTAFHLHHRHCRIFCRSGNFAGHRAKTLLIKFIPIANRLLLFSDRLHQARIAIYLDHIAELIPNQIRIVYSHIDQWSPAVFQMPPGRDKNFIATSQGVKSRHIRRSDSPGIQQMAR